MFFGKAIFLGSEISIYYQLANFAFNIIDALEVHMLRIATLTCCIGLLLGALGLDDRLPANAEPTETQDASNIIVISWRSKTEHSEFKCDTVEGFDQVTAYYMPQVIASAYDRSDEIRAKTKEVLSAVENFDQENLFTDRSGYGCHFDQRDATCTVSGFSVCSLINSLLEMRND